jgi:hypothetical protein
MNRSCFKQYYYCYDHDDAFYMITPAEKPSSDHLYIDRRDCELSHIGTRIYINNVLTEDTTPDDKWFERRGGGYCREYLDNSSQVDSI